MNGIQVDEIEPSDGFRDDLKHRGAAHRDAIRDALDMLLKNPRACSLRVHALKNLKPKVLKLDVYTSKSHQITFELRGSLAYLLRFGSHKQIDRDPR